MTEKKGKKEIIKKEETNVTKKITKECIQKYLKTFVTHNLTENEIEQFTEISVMNNLNPFKKEIHVVPFETSVYENGRWVKKRQLALITGYEVYLKRADKTGLCDGHDVWFEGEWGDPNFTCHINVFRKDRAKPTHHFVYFDEFKKTKKDGTLTGFWQKQPKFQIMKVAIGHGYRLTFPNELADMPYIQEELEGGFRDVTQDNRDEEILNELPAIEEPKNPQTEKAVCAKKEHTENAKKIEGKIDKLDKEYETYVEDCGASSENFDPIKARNEIMTLCREKHELFDQEHLKYFAQMNKRKDVENYPESKYKEDKAYLENLKPKSPAVEDPDADIPDFGFSEMQGGDENGKPLLKGCL